nr:gonadotropin-releasing hormone-2 [Stylochoplana pusilla]
MNRCVLLSMFAVVLLAVLDQAIGQNMHFSNGWQPGKRGDEEKKSTHDFFRVRRVYHFFRLRKSKQCIFDEQAKLNLLNQVREGRFCADDIRFLDSMIAAASEGGKR